MTTSIWQNDPARTASSPFFEAGPLGGRAQVSPSDAKWRIALDAIVVFGAFSIAGFVDLLMSGRDTRGSWEALFHQVLTWNFVAYFCGFCVLLVATNCYLNVYSCRAVGKLFNELRLTVQACLISGSIFLSIVYLARAEEISRRFILIGIGLVTIGVGLRRVIRHVVLPRVSNRLIGAHNVMVLGTDTSAYILRRYIDHIQPLGYAFSGFPELLGGKLGNETYQDIAGTVDELFKQVHMRFVDEIFISNRYAPAVILSVLDRASLHGVGLRLIHDIGEFLPQETPLEYLGDCATIPLHRGHHQKRALLFKHVFDIAFALIVVVVLSPLFLVIAIAIKLDSPGPILYASERIGRKKRIFRCFKFRTMIQDADQLRATLMEKNERDSILFKMSDDPRVTRVGRLLRRYSLDELPQFLNVIRGDMAVVGPRPALNDEVEKYEISHLRRLNIKPGITGLWQVQARTDPSFSRYVALDLAYIENWSVLLDLEIILRTIGVVFRGTGF